MNRIQNKLRSGKGASITFGLLLFLVCAILSSVILVAATTASGRIAGMAEMDQRYYSVTSAAELLKDMIEGKTVEVVRVEEFIIPEEEGAAEIKTSDKTTISMGGTRYEIESTYDDSGQISSTDVSKAGGIQEHFLTDAALRSVETSEVTADADPYYQQGISSHTRSLTMDAAGQDSLAAVAVESVNASVGGMVEAGTIVFQVCNAEKDGSEITRAKESYLMTLTFKADIAQEGPADVESISDTTKTKTRTTRTTLEWKLQSIQ